MADLFGWLPSPLTCIVTLGYFVLNLALNYYNVFLLGGGQGQLHLPIGVFYTMLHQITIVIFTALWCIFVPSVRFPIRSTFVDNWKWLFFVSSVYAMSIATNNASFASISLTVNTIFKSSIPFPTMVFSYFIEGKTYSVPVICIVSVLVAGTILAIPFHHGDAASANATHANGTVPTTVGSGFVTAATVTHSDQEWVGIVLVSFSSIATAMRPVISSYLMRSAEAAGQRKALTATSMAFWDAAIATPVLGITCLITDVYIRPGIQTVFGGEDALKNIYLVSIGCFMAGIYGPVTFYTIKLTSSLSFVIIGNFKQLALLTGAALFVDKVTEPLLWCGVAVVALTSLAYSYQTNMEKNAAAAAAAAKKANEATPLKDPLVSKA